MDYTSSKKEVLQRQREIRRKQRNMIAKSSNIVYLDVLNMKQDVKKEQRIITIKKVS